jgi:hypothetical protein
LVALLAAAGFRPGLVVSTSDVAVAVGLADRATIEAAICQFVLTANACQFKLTE